MGITYISNGFKLPTKRQIQVLEAQGKTGQTIKVANNTLGISKNAVGKSNTLLYQEFMQDLTLLANYYPLFRDRLLRDRNEVRELLLSLNRRIREDSAEKFGEKDLKT